MTTQQILEQIEQVRAKLLTKPGLIETVELTDLLLELYASYVYRTSGDVRKAA